ncbi:hypothetical protein [Alloprevotella sp. OH1205_COT-284]|nr:hypothetical protein [Alloprevotella sp. OH1205_COT-284]
METNCEYHSAKFIAVFRESLAVASAPECRMRGCETEKAVWKP